MDKSDVFESSQKCKSRRRVQFENFQNVTSDHKSRNAMQVQVHTMFCILYTPLRVFMATSVLLSITDLHNHH